MSGTNACVARNLIPKEDCVQIIEAVTRQKELLIDFEFPEGSVMESRSRDFWSKKNTLIEALDGTIDRDIFHRLEQQKEAVFREYLNKINDSNTYYLQKFTATHTWTSGEFLNAHRDRDGETSVTRHGLVFYLNNDFNGGELYYPDYDLTITPEPGMLVLHPGDILHGVNQVTSGVRHNMTCFAITV